LHVPTNLYFTGKAPTGSSIILMVYFFRAAFINEVECRAPASTERQIASRGSGRIPYTAAQSAF